MNSIMSIIGLCLSCLIEEGRETRTTASVYSFVCSILYNVLIFIIKARTQRGVSTTRLATHHSSARDARMRRPLHFVDDQISIVQLI
jgi:hypothetical protein